MAEAWHDRLNAALEQKGWGPADLVRALHSAGLTEIKYDRVYKWTTARKERREPKPPQQLLLRAVADAVGVNDLWLAYGVESTQTPSRIRLERIPTIHLSELSGLRSKADLPKMLKGRREISVPAQASPRAMVVALDDDSMVDKFLPGALIVCDPDQPPLPGKYVVAIVKRSGSRPRAVFRRYQELPAGQGVCALHPENQHYSPDKIRSDKDGFIIGRAVGLYTEL